MCNEGGDSVLKRHLLTLNCSVALFFVSWIASATIRMPVSFVFLFKFFSREKQEKYESETSVWYSFFYFWSFEVW